MWQLKWHIETHSSINPLSKSGTLTKLTMESMEIINSNSSIKKDDQTTASKLVSQLCNAGQILNRKITFKRSTIARMEYARNHVLPNDMSGKPQETFEMGDGNYNTNFEMLYRQMEWQTVRNIPALLLLQARAKALLQALSKEPYKGTRLEMGLAVKAILVLKKFNNGLQIIHLGSNEFCCNDKKIFWHTVNYFHVTIALLSDPKYATSLSGMIISTQFQNSMYICTNVGGVPRSGATNHTIDSDWAP